MYNSRLRHQISPIYPDCPDVPEPKAVHICHYCEEGIIAGDEFVEISGNFYHVSCLADEMTIYEILDLFGEQYEIAQEVDE